MSGRWAKRVAEAAVFTGLATAVHAALIAGLGWPGGLPEGAGAGGEARVTVVSVPSGGLAAAVAAWDAAPEVSAAVAEARVRPPAPAAAERLPAEAARAERAARPAAPARPAADAAPPGPVAAPERPVPAAPVLRQALARPAPPDAPRPAPRPVPTVRPGAPGQPADAGTRPEVARAPAPAAVPRPAEEAAGAGQGARQGAARPDPSSGGDAAAQRSLVAAWGGAIRAQIEARKRQLDAAAGTGRAVVRIIIARDGRLLDAGLARSSGVRAVDRAALGAVRRAGRFPAAPEGLALARARFDLPISFTR